MKNLAYTDELNNCVINVRRKYFLSQSQFAKIFGIGSAKTISHWETGFRKIPLIIQRISNILMAAKAIDGEELLYLFACQADDNDPPDYKSLDWKFDHDGFMDRIRAHNGIKCTIDENSTRVDSTQDHDNSESTIVT